MTEGFVPDSTYGAILQTHWYAGKPEATSFLGLPTGLSVDRSRMLPISAWRCAKCGAIRLYADPQD
jgi:hypothetical protein